MLLAWTKIVLAEELLASDLPDDPFLRTRPVRVLPDADARRATATQIERPPAAPRDHRDPGGQRPGQRRRHDLLAAAVRGDRRDAPRELTRANFVAREIFGSLRAARGDRRRYDNLLDAARADPDADRDAHPGRAGVALAGQQPAAAARQRGAPSSSSRVPVQRVMAELPDLMTGRELAAFEARRDALVAARACPRTWRPGSRCCHPAYMLLGIVEIADREGARPRRGGPACTSRSASGSGCRRWSAGSSRCRATTAGRRWPARRCATTCTPCTPSSPPRCSRDHRRRRLGAGADRGLGGRRRRRGRPRGRDTLEEICADDSADLARMSVGLRVVRGLLAGAA